jgi:hypothetical protein
MFPHTSHVESIALLRSMLLRQDRAGEEQAGGVTEKKAA